jgi:roadblock/LC7 domain-containing protein
MTFDGKRTVTWTEVLEVVVLLFVFMTVAQAAGQESSALTRQKAMEAYRHLPFSFERNQGQTDKRVRFVARGPKYSLFLTGEQAVLRLSENSSVSAGSRVARRGRAGWPRPSTLRIGLWRSLHSEPLGMEKLAGSSNYFVGNDKTKWHTNVPTFGAVKYEGVYPGIDLVYRGNEGQLEYDFMVAPGGDPQKIELSFQGGTKLNLNRAGDLVICIGKSQVIQHAPVIYQELAGQHQIVAGRYELRGRTRVGFSLATYDKSRPLVIDPTLVYSTYLGGTGGDIGVSIAVDSSGHAYVTGYTGSLNFPVTSSAVQTILGGAAYVSDAFVCKLNTTGSALVYSTYLGGSDFDAGHAIAVDASRNVYVTGTTGSADFPVTAGAFQTAIAGSYDVFVTKLNAAGSALVYSTYLGGTNYDEAGGLAVDASRNVYVTGTTVATNFPVTSGALQTALTGFSDAFVTKLNAAGSALVYSTYLGGSDSESAAGIALDTSGNVYVTGGTGSANFPVSSGAFQTAIAGPSGVFVTKVNAAGSALVYSTYLGGSNFDNVSSIALDSSGNVYVTGGTNSADFPVSSGAFQTTLAGASDVFVTKLNATGSALVYSTYLGGSEDENLYGETGYGIAIDSSGNAYIAGTTSSANFPVTADAFQIAYGGYSDAFVTELNAAGSALVYSTYLGGSYGEIGLGIAVDSVHIDSGDRDSGDHDSVNIYITGFTGSSDFPVTSRAFQPSLRTVDAFVTKLKVHHGRHLDQSERALTTAAQDGAGNDPLHRP